MRSSDAAELSVIKWSFIVIGHSLSFGVADRSSGEPKVFFILYNNDLVSSLRYILTIQPDYADRSSVGKVFF